MESKLQELKGRLREVVNLRHVDAVLGWDLATNMPATGAAERGKQMATVQRLAHEALTDPAVGKLLDALDAHGRSLPYDSVDAAFLREARRQYDLMARVPSSFLADFAAHSAVCYQTWTEARPKNDFEAVRPLLERTLDLSRRYADFHPGYEHIADPLIDHSDYGMKASTVRTIFGELKNELAPVVKSILAQTPADDSCLHLHFPDADQIAFGERVIRDFGFDFESGRQDRSPHPFMTKFSLGDFRITTRVLESDLATGLFGTLHECGHALYEMGIDKSLEGTLLAGGTSSGVHESQSRTWENIVGRSRGFWEHYYGDLQKTFPALANVSLEAFYRAINKVSASPIRVEADEVTYNLHVIIRFELELQLLEGSLAIKDLPDAWVAAYEENLGLTPPSLADGVLQDVHWFGDYIGGAFQGYTLGNIMSAQFYAEALKAHPSIPDDVRNGRFATLRGWLTDNVYRWGSMLTAPELIERVTGGPISTRPYVDYLRTKFGDLYELESAKT